jgi:hypothetical protein
MQQRDSGDPGDRRADGGTIIMDSFQWDMHETLGGFVLGILAFYLVAKLIACYERLLQAYAAGYTPDGARAPRTEGN